MKKILTAIIISGICLHVLAQSGEIAKDQDYLVTLSTPYGDIKAILFDDTPQHKENFIRLAQMGLFNGVIFHRVIDHFMIQGGDPKTRPQGLTPEMKKAVSKRIPPEFSDRYQHHRGAIGAARSGDPVNPYKLSNPSQFYIVENHKGAHHLDGEYTIFGQVMSGLPVIDSIAAQPTDKKDRPLKDISMKVNLEVVKRANVEKFYNYRYHGK